MKKMCPMYPKCYYIMHESLAGSRINVEVGECSNLNCGYWIIKKNGRIIKRERENYQT